MALTVKKSTLGGTTFTVTITVSYDTVIQRKGRGSLSRINKNLEVLGINNWSGCEECTAALDEREEWEKITTATIKRAQKPNGTSRVSKLVQ
jgi:hypothetical protein